MDERQKYVMDSRARWRGQEALYWASRGFSLVRITDVGGDEWGMYVCVELMPTPGLQNDRPDEWRLNGCWDVIECGIDFIGMSGVDEAIIIGKEVVEGVLAICGKSRGASLESIVQDIWEMLEDRQVPA